MNFFILTTGIFLAFLGPAEAQAQTTPSALQKTLKKYAKASSLQFDIKKTDEKVTLGTKSESEGLLKYQKNKIYILQNGEKKTEIYYFNKSLTLVEHPDLDFGTDGKRKVTILKNTPLPLINSLLSLFSDTKNFNKQFLTVSERNIDGVFIVELQPQRKTDSEKIKGLILKISNKNFELLELSFVDDIETKTTLQFENSKINMKMKKSEFQYRSLKSDEVLIQ